MKVIFAAVAALLGSVAFQMTVDAGYLHHLSWVIPWCWGGCAALWMAWALIHDKIVKQWLKGLHERLGKGIYPIRAFICLIVFFIVAIVVQHLTGRTVEASPGQSKDSPAQSNTVQGNNNTTGNIGGQTGNGNNAAIGNGNKVGNTYNIGTEDKWENWLRPDHQPDPDTTCVGEDENTHTVIPNQPFKRPQGTQAIYFGGSVFAASKFPLIALAVAGKPTLILDKNSDGRIAITTWVFDDEPSPRIIAKIVKNKFTVNRNNVESMKLSSDKSNLIVLDQHDTEVLNVKYLNKDAITMTGVLHFSELKGPVTITDRGITYLGKIRFFNNCATRWSVVAPMYNIIEDGHISMGPK
jgi:hypothetical protein